MVLIMVRVVHNKKVNKLNAITAHSVQRVLAILWLFDGFLQLQPQMFSSHFALQVIAPAGNGQPNFVYSPVHFIARLIMYHPTIWTLVFALLQMVLGVLLLQQRTVRIGLIASAVWALLVWYLGEGLGGLLTGHTLLFTGAPGAALLYAVIALSVMPQKRRQASIASWLGYMWLGIWVGGGLLVIWSQVTPKDIASMVMAMGKGAPGWVAAIDMHAGNWIGERPSWFVALCVCIEFFIGVAILLPKYIRSIGVAVGILITLIYWVVGQNFGELFSGLATDPGTGPLMLLLSLAVLRAGKIHLRLT